MTWFQTVQRLPEKRLVSFDLNWTSFTLITCIFFAAAPSSTPCTQHACGWRCGTLPTWQSLSTTRNRSYGRGMSTAVFQAGDVALPRWTWCGLSATCHQSKLYARIPFRRRSNRIQMCPWQPLEKAVWCGRTKQLQTSEPQGFKKQISTLFLDVMRTHPVKGVSCTIRVF